MFLIVSGGQADIAFKKATFHSSAKLRKGENVQHLFRDEDEDEDSDAEIEKTTLLYMDGPKKRYFSKPRRKGYNNVLAEFKV
jgi:hypothetical protein